MPLLMQIPSLNPPSFRVVHHHRRQEIDLIYNCHGRHPRFRDDVRQLVVRRSMDNHPICPTIEQRLGNRVIISLRWPRVNQ
ncbi:MAG: hypothetical protein ABT04_04175 [Granulicella sp. SCN 62-9]|nr:MAG: hypothetical protein ABT04_04175 [Granulicella sp. SCN 62-9]